jgi:hypothetical protein
MTLSKPPALATWRRGYNLFAISLLPTQSLDPRGIEPQSSKGFLSCAQFEVGGSDRHGNAKHSRLALLLSWVLNLRQCSLSTEHGGVNVTR